ncbi:hypothetical protein V8C43DRAFT_272613 [Trichoderma afarasin]
MRGAKMPPLYRHPILAAFIAFSNSASIHPIYVLTNFSYHFQKDIRNWRSPLQSVVLIIITITIIITLLFFLPSQPR